VLVIGNGAAEFREAAATLQEGQQVVDLVRIGKGRSQEGRYDGICW
jgi:hypothetical protein